jgi:dihydroorotate dehydrogenase electron transfer subunit
VSAHAPCATDNISRHGPSRRVLAHVVSRAHLGSLVWLTLDVPGWSGAAPGQFALLQPQPSRCFLARALSIADEAGESVSFLVAPVGEGTRELCDLDSGAAVWVMGPLGNGFDVERIAGDEGSSPTPARFSTPAPGSGRPRLLIVAGGVGAAPFPLLLSRLADLRAAGSVVQTSVAAPLHRNLEVVVLLGFRDAVQAQAAAPVVEAVSRSREAGLSCRCVVAAEDGSCGLAEKVTDLLARELLAGDRLFVCGPAAMATSVWRICRSVAKVQAWFSLEAGMACGVGSCHGCALTLADGSLARVCRDGPVFSGESVFGSTAAVSAMSDGGEWRP